MSIHPPNCFVIIIPKSDSETLKSEKLNYQQQNNLIQAYVDTLFQSGVNEFDKWRQTLSNEQLSEIIPKRLSADV